MFVPKGLDCVWGDCFLTTQGGSDGSASVSASGGTQGYSYSWNTIPVKTNSSVSWLIAGTYKCTVTDSKGCVVKKLFLITQPALKGMHPELQNIQMLEAYPNPTAGVINLRITGFHESEMVETFLMDISGRIVYQSQLFWKTDEDKKFDFSGVSKGIYFISVAERRGRAPGCSLR